MSAPKETVLRALSMLKGDDTYRARLAFRGMTAEQMNEQHGQSGITRAKILADYEAHDAQVDVAIAWVNSK